MSNAFKIHIFRAGIIEQILALLYGRERERGEERKHLPKLSDSHSSGVSADKFPQAREKFKIFLAKKKKNTNTNFQFRFNTHPVDALHAWFNNDDFDYCIALRGISAGIIAFCCVN